MNQGGCGPSNQGGGGASNQDGGGASNQGGGGASNQGGGGAFQGRNAQKYQRHLAMAHRNGILPASKQTPPEDLPLHVLAFQTWINTVPNEVYATLTGSTEGVNVAFKAAAAEELARCYARCARGDLASTWSQELRDRVWRNHLESGLAFLPAKPAQPPAEKGEMDAEVAACEDRDPMDRSAKATPPTGRSASTWEEMKEAFRAKVADVDRRQGHSGPRTPGVPAQARADGSWPSQGGVSYMPLGCESEDDEGTECVMDAASRNEAAGRQVEELVATVHSQITHLSVRKREHVLNLLLVVM